MTAIERALADALERLGALDFGDAFEPRAAEAIVASGLHRLVVPESLGGLGARMAEAAGVLTRLGALDGSTALGFAMQVHVVGALGTRRWCRQVSASGCSIPLTVSVVEPTGSETLVFGEIDGVSICGAFAERHGFKQGELVTLSPRLDAVHLFDRATGKAIRPH